MTAYRREGETLEKGKRLFVTDLDGTLLDDHKRIAPRDLAALARLRQLGVSVALATGRSDYSVDRLLEQLTQTDTFLPADHIIFSTGAGIMDFPGRRLLKSFALPPEDVRRISRMLDSLALDYMIHRPVPDTRRFLYREGNAGKNPDFHRRLALYNSHATPLSPAALAAIDGATEVLCIVPAEIGHPVAEQLTAGLPGYSVIKATSPLDGHSIWIEIFAPAVSKSQAVQWLAGELGVEREQVCAVGNDYNDEDLLHWAGRSFVVANSPPPILARFRSVASNNEAGVSEAVGRWLGLSGVSPEFSFTNQYFVR